MKETTTQPEGGNARVARIKELAASFETLSPEDKAKLRAFIDQELKDEIASLESRLASLRQVANVAPTTTGRFIKAKVKIGRKPQAEGKRGGRQKGGMTTGAAVLKALEGGKKDVASLVEEVGKLKGGKVSKASVGQELVRLKKDNKVKNPERGVYELA